MNGKVYYNVSSVAGTVVFEIPNLTHGNKTVVATYVGDNKYRFNSTTANFTVYKRTPDIVVEAEQNKKVDEDVRITVTDIPADATGYVVVEVIGVANYTINLTSQKYVDIKGLPAGTYRVNATYIGDEKYVSSYYDQATFTVSKWDATGIQIRADDINYTETAVVIITVPDGITGNITIQLNDTAKTHITLPIFENKVVWNVSGLAAGKYKVNATYNGDYKYNINNTLSDTFVVKRITPVMDINDPLTADGSAMATIGQNAEIVVVIGGNFSGETVTVDGLDRDGYTAVFVYHASNNTSTAKFITDGALVNNEYTITATYAGNENYTGATATYTFTPAKISDYTIEVTGMNITYKDDEIITVTVPTGVTNVSIWVDGIKRTNSSFTPGEAKFNVTDLNLAAGVHYVNATVNDEDYASKVANNMFIVAPRNTTLYIAVHTVTIWDKEYVNVTIMDANGDVMTDASGKFNITINGVDHPVEIVSGVARFNTADLVVGENTVCGRYR